MVLGGQRPPEVAGNGQKASIPCDVEAQAAGAGRVPMRCQEGTSEWSVSVWSGAPQTSCGENANTIQGQTVSVGVGTQDCQMEPPSPFDALVTSSTEQSAGPSCRF